MAAPTGVAPAPASTLAPAVRPHATPATSGLPRPRDWFLYLIECVDASIYTGIAVDVAARYAAHASGKGARYTRAHPPRRLLAVVPFADRSSASQAEYAVKQLSAREKRALVAVLAVGLGLPASPPCVNAPCGRSARTAPDPT